MQLKSVDVVKAYISRQKAVNPIINAITESRVESALKEAQAVDDKIRDLLQRANSDSPDAEAAKSELKRIEVEQPFLGVPVSVKHFFLIQNFLETGGSLARFRKGKRSTHNAELVDSLQRAGAILLCHTNAPEQGLWPESSNPVFGRSLNPYDTRRTCGGSSSGEGALVRK